MPRMGRAVLPDYPLHIIQRRHNRQVVFAEAIEKPSRNMSRQVNKSVPSSVLTTTPGTWRTIWLLLLLAGCAWTPAPQVARTEIGKYSYIAGGQGEPAVIFEANLGNGKAVWDPVFQKLSRTTRVFAYDRAGNGESVARSNDRSGSQIVKELHWALEVADIRPPYIFVSHSLGRMYAELYARTYPGEVAGVVFIDGRYRDYVLACYPMTNRAEEFCPASAVMLETFSKPPNAGVKEYQGVAATRAQLKDAGPFPPVPLIVISGTRHITAAPVDQKWLAAQGELAKLSPLGRELRCASCGFAVQHDDPGLVIGAVLDVVKQAREKR
jgi:pimeloyl-ACP methyl ester carboxylesterase